MELIFFSFDNEKGSSLYKIDPAGHYMGYFGVSTGSKDLIAEGILEKSFKENN